MYNLWNRIKSGISDIVKSRTFIAIIMFCVLSAVLLQRVFYLQIVKGQNYTDKYELQIQKTKEVEEQQACWELSEEYKIEGDDFYYAAIFMTATVFCLPTMNWLILLPFRIMETMIKNPKKIKL
mgnify:CR=1 FL=1